MKEEISLDIDFTEHVNKQQQYEFLDELIELIEQLNLLAGGGLKDRKLGLVLDCRSATLTAGEIMDEIGDFLMEKEEWVTGFEME